MYTRNALRRQGQTHPQPIPTRYKSIYRERDLGLISASDGYSWMTMSDGILETDTGHFFQWGNCYGFPQRGFTVAFGPTDASGYGPGNYYTSDIFYGYVYQWDDSLNSNLWGGDTNTYEARRGPCEEGWHIPSADDWRFMLNVLPNVYSSTVREFYKIGNYGYLDDWTGGYRTSSTDDLWTSDFYYRHSGGTYGGSYCLTVSTRNNSASVIAGWTGNGVGHVIRPFKNEPVTPDTSWIKIWEEPHYN